MAGLKEKDLLFVRYERGSQHTECLPYYIALDQETKSVGAAVQTHMQQNAQAAAVTDISPPSGGVSGKASCQSGHRVVLLQVAASCMTSSAGVS